MNEALVIVVMIVAFVVVVYGLYWLDRRRDYRRAKNNIFTYVKGFKRRCTGNNRFVVSPIILQDAFREYDIKIIERVFLELIQEHIIDRDPLDNEWVMR